MCGVFGAVLPAGEPTEAANVAALGLFALQHRGQESAGIATSEGGHIMTVRDLGLVSQVFDEEKLQAASVHELVNVLSQRSTKLAGVLALSSLLVDGLVVRTDAPLVDGQTLEVLPPFAGG